MRKKQKSEVCSNCNSQYIEGDKYCRYCGALMGEPEYIDTAFACIYGPPFVAVHTCETCGYSWKCSGLGKDRQRRCPKCGGLAPAVLDEDEW